ncbi:putative pilus assembly protein FilE [Acinetobacter sp.]|uniref:putative pilus assembly protein FilE n=1 Tax=Acinetobacter sp. TaxID=472 RepID=UPI002838228E|nr:putative pilus assembly protein FilE [Acinetobacter sp.]
MHLKAEKKIVLTSLWLAIGMSFATSACYASSFYTIIGPDGHPMIIQKPETAPKPETKPQKSEKKPVQIANPAVSVPPKPNAQQNENIQQPESSAPVIVPQQNISSTPIIDHSSETQPKPQKKVQVLPQPQPQPQPQPALVKKVEQSKKVDLVEDAKQVDQVKKVAESKKVEPRALKAEDEKVPNTAAKTQNIQATDDKNFTMIDGEKYVNNEYLEDREFNLEGKKRFYMTPEVGAVHGRYETIERQKGLSASLLERIRGNTDTQEKKPVVLSSTYFRLPKDEVVQNLEQACFSGKKVAKAKGLSIKNQELGLWPVAPIKEHFAYEVIKLDTQVQNILLTSYASSSKAQTYYWPLAVFLDDQGCVIEGVSGFKNEESHDSNLQYAAMEGVLRKPEKAAYLFLTPLSSAIDVENKQLTNHGQIKLSVIQ